MNELHQLYFASKHGGLVNKNGGCYQSGKSYGLDVKLFVAAKYPTDVLAHLEMSEMNIYARRKFR